LPEDGEVHLWRARLDLEESAIRAMEGLLAPDERIRAHRFHHQNHRKRFTVARVLLRKILAHYVATEPADIEIRYGPYGKPCLRPCSSGREIHFSVSHSEDAALYGVTTNCHIGVDIERVRPIPELDAIARNLFCAAEQLILQRGTPHERMERFFEFWKRKEA